MLGAEKPNLGQNIVLKGMDDASQDFLDALV